MDKLKLNLGCGHTYIKGFVNIDKTPWGCTPDLIADALDLHMYENDMVDHIHTYALLEHIPPWDTLKALREWFRVLKSGGTIHIEVPDLVRIYEDWLVHGIIDEQTAIDFIFGGGKSSSPPYEEQHHLTGFTYSRLARMMKQVGFAKISQVESARFHWVLAIDARKPN